MRKNKPTVGFCLRHSEEWRIKIDILLFNRWIWAQITPKGVYIINAKHCISSRRSLVYHHCESNTTCGWWYTPSVMKCTLTRDDMPLLSQWIKNSTSRNLSNFWCTRLDSNQRHQASEACALSSWATDTYFFLSPTQGIIIVLFFFAFGKCFLTHFSSNAFPFSFLPRFYFSFSSTCVILYPKKHKG